MTRRRVMAGSLAGAAASLAGLRVGLDPAMAQALTPLRWAGLTPGFTVLPIQYILANKLGEKHGIKLDNPTPYTAVSTYYNDFVAGNYDVCIGSWDTFAARGLAGVPLQYLCTITTADMIGVLAPKGGVKDLSQIKGKTFAGLQSTGTYRMVKALIREVYGFDIEKEATVQSVDNPAATVTLLMADRADAALSWEPNVTTGLMKKPDLHVIFNAGEAYRKLTGRTLPYFGVAVRKELIEKNPGIAEKLSAVFKACLDGINADPAKAVDLFGSKTGIPEDVFKQSMTSGRLRFVFEGMSDPQGRENIQKASEFLARNNLLPRPVDPSFFAA
jgi:NitT/TauT family transport system substrate-binding protein